MITDVITLKILEQINDLPAIRITKQAKEIENFLTESLQNIQQQRGKWN